MAGPQLITTGVIARRLGVSIHRVLYVLRTRTHIRPKARGGPYWLYSEADVRAVAEALDDIQARRLRRPAR